ERQLPNGTIVRAQDGRKVIDRAGRVRGGHRQLAASKRRFATSRRSVARRFEAKLRDQAAEKRSLKSKVKTEKSKVAETGRRPFQRPAGGRLGESGLRNGPSCAGPPASIRSPGSNATFAFYRIPSSSRGRCLPCRRSSM